MLSCVLFVLHPLAVNVPFIEACTCNVFSYEFFLQIYACSFCFFCCKKSRCLSRSKYEHFDLVLPCVFSQHRCMCSSSACLFLALGSVKSFSSECLWAFQATCFQLRILIFLFEQHFCLCFLYTSCQLCVLRLVHTCGSASHCICGLCGRLEFVSLSLLAILWAICASFSLPYFMVIQRVFMLHTFFFVYGVFEKIACSMKRTSDVAEKMLISKFLSEKWQQLVHVAG